MTEPHLPEDVSLLLSSLETGSDGTCLAYIDGSFVQAETGDMRALYYPATNEFTAMVTEAAEAEAEAAVQAARRAFDQDGWPETDAYERAGLLHRLADELEQEATVFARLETINSGKPLRECILDVEDAVRCFRYFAGLATTDSGQMLDTGADIQTTVVRDAVGVCVQIIPWNFPLLIAVWKLAPALAAGNTCIVKPSEFTPLSVLKLAELMHRVGFPKGVVNVVPGRGSVIGQYLAEHKLVDKVAFTGGTETGRKILQAAASNMKNVSLELGGKSPNIIFADADFDTAVDYALLGVFMNAGQVCAAGSRILVEDSIYNRFVAALAAKAQNIALGDSFSDETEMGPLISKTHMEKVENYIRLGLAEGATLLTGGKRHEHFVDGNYLLPTLFTDTTPDMRIVQEEIFGPVGVIQRFSTEDEAVELANNSQYGLAAGVFTTDGAKAQRVVRKLRAGITWINTYHPAFVEAPWGGYKQSGLGRELGTQGYEAYTETKQISTNLNVQPSGWYRGQDD
ncbi:aldehyde dehydrogenase family protein [Alicyclobacillus sp. SO9]|uniref:aldehyde dehydrogenase family protein n=1 Tax=Alicyclobacillus sp. SO9 TaxID=2665646 RepID=UPI0018E7E9AA|nr:aldehyde dehydrogenase family protein [Alicyclobacillus sp. SO9]QQE79306.1 aldehyde dehydrogenase family protein [Alicyclobacillus sp. SO9]